MPEQTSVPWRWRDVGAVLLLVVAGTAALSIALRALAVLADDSIGAGMASPLLYLAGLGFYGLLFVGVYLFAVRRGGWAALGWRPAPSLIMAVTPLFVLLGFTAVFAVNSTIALVQGGTFENPQIAALTGGQALSTGWLLLLLLLVAGIAPLSEELFFRGMIYPLLRQRLGVAAAIVGSAAIFAVCHLIPPLFPALFVVGLLLALLREWSASLYPCILYHALQNGVVLLAISALLG